MADKVDVRRGTLALMILKTLEALGPRRGYGLARRTEQTKESREWGRTAAIPARFFGPAEES